MRRTLLRPAAILLVALTALAAYSAVAALGQASDPGTPLTKEEYFEQSVGVMAKVDKANFLLLKLDIHHFPRRQCAKEARRYDRRLVGIFNEASTVIPPPEISGIHDRLKTQAVNVLNAIHRISRRVKSGKVICGYDIEHPAPNRIGVKASKAYERSGFDQTLQQLRDLGYVPSGE